ncbi:MAG TPA: 30S ribosomal protein S20 [Candidatus Baltobacteraceae bacterium]|nr:30S ribosomal protein S20 [Candidatus Baltobacteraceae bacterium]
MPNIKAAEKWVRQSAKRTTRNLDVKTRLKTLYKKAVSAQDAEVIQSVEAQFDKAAQKGIIHPNKAARKKSRLAKAAAKAATAAAAPAAKSTGKKKSAK